MTQCYGRCDGCTLCGTGLHCTVASQSQAKRSITPDGQAWQAARKAVHLSPPSSPLPTAAGADGSGFNGTAAGPLSSALPPAASRSGQPPTPPIAVPQQPSSAAAANRRPSPSFSAGSSSSGGVSGSQVGHSRQRSNERIPRPRKNLTPQERLEEWLLRVDVPEYYKQVLEEYFSALGTVRLD